jgi:hypothetical protein
VASPARTPYDGGVSAPAPTRTSLWAIASLVCGVLPCPPLCAIAIVLGVVGLVQIRVRPAITGTRLALAGIALGLLASAAWSAGFVWWHVEIRRPLIEGPRDALAAGFAGDVDGFRAAFRDPASPGEAAAFLAELGRRYGSFLDMAQDGTPSPDGARAVIDRDRPVVRYRLRFARGNVPGEAQFVRADGAAWPMVLRWGWLHIHDAVRGDLAYPLAAGDRPVETDP